MKKILSATVLSLSFLSASAFSQIMVTTYPCPVGVRCHYEFGGLSSRDIHMVNVAKGASYNCHFENMHYVKITNWVGNPSTIALTKTDDSNVVINAQKLTSPFGEGIITVYSIPPKTIYVQCSKISEKLH